MDKQYIDKTVIKEKKYLVLKKIIDDYPQLVSSVLSIEFDEISYLRGKTLYGLTVILKVELDKSLISMCYTNGFEFEFDEEGRIQLVKYFEFIDIAVKLVVSFCKKEL